jgi:hypothetical protein
MKSPVITQPLDGQLTLSFEKGISERHGSLRECIATGIYQRGLGSVAIDLDKASSNLSAELSGSIDTQGRQRQFGVDALEKYIEKTGDTAPIHYLIDKFLNDKAHKQDAAMAQLAPMLKQLAPLMRQAGLI